MTPLIAQVFTIGMIKITFIDFLIWGVGNKYCWVKQYEMFCDGNIFMIPL